MENKKINSESIKNLLNTLSGSIENDNIELYKKLSVEDGYKEVNIEDNEDFYYKIMYPFEKYVKGLISEEITNNTDVRFILMNYHFIERNFSNLIQEMEGSACSADKSRTIVRRLYQFYKDGKKIEWDYSGEYTFNLPKFIFKTHDDIVLFYGALKDIHYGSYKQYLKALQTIMTNYKSNTNG